MTNILERVARSSSSAPKNAFQPASPTQFFALRLAQKLGDARAADHYLALTDQYSEAQLLFAYRRACNRAGNSDLARSFHVELQRLGERAAHVPSRRLAAIRIERRAIAVVVLNGVQLEYAVVRQLSSDSNKALGSAASFITRMIERFSFETAALEVVPQPNEAQRSLLMEIICRILTEQGVAIWQVPKREVLAAFAYPPLRFRKQLRELISGMWPTINGSFGGPLLRDALALCLYCQTEHLFNL